MEDTAALDRLDEDELLEPGVADGVRRRLVPSAFTLCATIRP